MGQGFQFTPMGLRPIGDASGIDVNAQHGAAVPLVAQPLIDDDAEQPAPPVAQRPRAPLPVAKTAAAAASAPITPRGVVKAARARVKEIRAELRRMRALQKELGQLERMLAAAAKPLASLTPINSRRAG